MTESLSECVREKMGSDDPKDKDFTQKQKLGKYYGICRQKQDFIEDVDYKSQIHKKIHDFIIEDLIEKSNLKNLVFKEITTETADFIVEDAVSLKSWMERWKGAHFFAPDLPLSQAATAGKTESSNISWIGYDKKNLRVGFKSGSTYEYDVEPKFYEYMAGAPSKGKFLWNYLRGRTPGRVIDRPWKTTPGGVGGSIVPYSKISPRLIPKRAMKRVQKAFAKEIERGTMLKEVSKVRAQKAAKEQKPKVMTAGQKSLIGRLERRYKRDFETSDVIPVKKYTRTDPRTGKQIEVRAFERKGEAKKAVMKKLREKKPEEVTKRFEKILIPEGKKKLSKEEKSVKKWLEERKGKKPEEAEEKPKARRGLTPEERKRKEIERQARGIKKQPAADPREEAVRKLIEKTGYDRERAEAEIRKKLGPSKEEIATEEKQKKIQEKTQKQIEQKRQQLNTSIMKLQMLNQRNFKSEALKNILQLFVDLVKGKDILNSAKKFARSYNRLKRDQRINLQKKSTLLNVVNKLHGEIQGLSAPKKDFDNLKHVIEDRWITKHGRHIWIKNWYTPEELNKYDPKTGAGIHEVEPWLRIDRSVDLSKEGISIGLLNRTLETFPLKLKNMINEIRVFNKITDHPSMMKDKGKVPKSYEAVGWDRTYDDVGGVYIPSENNAYISTKASPHTVRHELGHAVWYGMSKRERDDFENIWFLRRNALFRKADEAREKAKGVKGFSKKDHENTARRWEYEARDMGEFFAESFERYYEAKRPVWEWKEPERQKQPFPEVSTFFRRRMKKYEKD